MSASKPVRVFLEDPDVLFLVNSWREAGFSTVDIVTAALRGFFNHTEPKEKKVAALLLEELSRHNMVKMARKCKKTSGVFDMI